MANIELVVKIPEEMYNWVNDANKFSNDYGTSDFIDLVKNGTPLPKGHGDLMDRSDLIPDSDYEDGTFYAVSIGAINSAPTIVEADRSDDYD